MVLRSSEEMVAGMFHQQMPPPTEGSIRTDQHNVVVGCAQAVEEQTFVSLKYHDTEMKNIDSQ